MALIISSCSWITSVERVLRSIPGWVLGCGVGRDTGCHGTFPCQGWGEQMADWDSLVRSGCLQQHLLGGSYWLRHGQIWPVWPKWALLSDSQWGNLSHWYWSSWGTVPWGWAGGVQHHPRQELLKLNSHAGVVSHFTRTSCSQTQGGGWCRGFAGTWEERHLVTWHCPWEVHLKLWRLMDRPAKGIHIPHG